jgi:hypothetical protein
MRGVLRRDGRDGTGPVQVHRRDRFEVCLNSSTADGIGSGHGHDHVHGPEYRLGGNNGLARVLTRPMEPGDDSFTSQTVVMVLKKL